MIPIKGIYRDTLVGVDKQLVYDSGWISNTIVDGCHLLLAAFMKNNQTTAGIQFLAVGRGEDNWDSQGIPSSTSDTTYLSNPAKDAPINNLQLVYLDDNETVTSNPTNRLQINATLVPNYPLPITALHTYPLREFGLFGRLNGVDYMINHVRHPVIHKDASTTLIRTIRLYF